MIIKDLEKCTKFQAQDQTAICELLHPDREKVEIPYSLAFAELPPGKSSLAHRLKESSEVFYIIQGEGVINVDDEMAEIKAGQAVLIPSGSWQQLKNTGSKTLKFLCIVFPRWRKEDEEIRDI